MTAQRSYAATQLNTKARRREGEVAQEVHRGLASGGKGDITTELHGEGQDEDGTCQNPQMAAEVKATRVGEWIMMLFLWGRGWDTGWFLARARKKRPDRCVGRWAIHVGWPRRSRPGADGLLDALVLGRSMLDGLVCRSGRKHARGWKPLALFVRLVSNRPISCFHEKIFDRG